MGRTLTEWNGDTGERIQKKVRGKEMKEIMRERFLRVLKWGLF
jgi:hypothetical protein